MMGFPYCKDNKCKKERRRVIREMEKLVKNSSLCAVCKEEMLPKKQIHHDGFQDLLSRKCGYYDTHIKDFNARYRKKGDKELTEQQLREIVGMHGLKHCPNCKKKVCNLCTQSFGHFIPADKWKKRNWCRQCMGNKLFGD